jgi:hypothetical protein
MKIRFLFAWFDFWIGWYYDRENRVLYICPLPMCVISVDFSMREPWPDLNDSLDKYFDSL